MYVLSIDPGETMIGYTITNKDTVLTWGHIKRKRCKQRSKTHDFVDQKLNNILKQYQIDTALIEVHTLNFDKFREDENEIVETLASFNIKIELCEAKDYLNHFNLIGYDKKSENLFIERQKEVFKRFKVKTKSRHNIDCLLMASYFLDKKLGL